MVSEATLSPDITALPGIILPEKSVTFHQRIGAGGYKWRDDAIKEKDFLPTLPAGRRNLALAHFKGVRTSQEVEFWAKESGYEIAIFDDLLAVGSHLRYGELQLQFPIIQLGSSAIMYGHRHVPYLYGVVGYRNLGVHSYYSNWDEKFRLLLVRKS